MPSFGSRSRARLDECHPALVKLFQDVVETRDCVIVCGYRGQEEQERAFDQGLTTLHYPNSKHNVRPARAVDVAPYIGGEIPWKDVKAFIFFAGYVFRVAYELAIPIRWGGDWDQDLRLDDQRLNDYPHFELPKEWEPA